MFRMVVGSVAAASLYLASSLAVADTATCPDDVVNPNSYARDISLTSDADVTCYAFGTGNIPSDMDINFANDFPMPSGDLAPESPAPDQDWSWIDTWEVSNYSSTNGFLSFEGGAISLNSGLVGEVLGVLIKVGGGTGDPDWAFFTLSAFDDVLQALISGGNGGGISHISIFCQGECTPDRDVPEPGTLALLGLGLAGLGFGARRRKQV